jgi:hypothetical protein
MAAAASGHWDRVYGTTSSDAVSWYQPEASTSYRLIRAAATGGTGTTTIDIGAGTSPLVDALLHDGWTDLTLLDVSAEAFEVVRERLGSRSADVQFIVTDLLTWQPDRGYDIWHDRAVFHFLTGDPERQRYVELATSAVKTDGALVLGTFAQDGPQECSGLPTCRYGAEELAATFAPGFALEHQEREQHPTPFGATQPFTWVTLRRK